MKIKIDCTEAADALTFDLQHSPKVNADAAYALLRTLCATLELAAADPSVSVEQLTSDTPPPLRVSA